MSLKLKYLLKKHFKHEKQLNRQHDDDFGFIKEIFAKVTPYVLSELVANRTSCGS